MAAQLPTGAVRAGDTSGVPPGPTRRTSGTGTGLTAEQSALLAAAVGMEDDVWDIATEYAERTLVKRNDVWYRLPYVDGVSPSTGDDPELGAPWEVFALTVDAGGAAYPETLAQNTDYIESRFYPLVGFGNAFTMTTQATAANRADLQLWVPDRDVTFDQLGVYVTTGVASAQAKVLVYDSDVAGWPDALLYSSEALDCATSSTFPNDTTGLPTFTAGVRYWVGIIADSTATLRAAAPTGRSLGMNSSGDASMTYALRRTGLTFASPPDPWTWVVTDCSSANTNIVIGRK